MVSKLISAAVFSSILGLTMLSSQAEARRLFWWEALPPENGGGYDVFSDDQDGYDGQDEFAQDMFNQEQYDKYMSEMNHRRHRRIYDQSYYDPQVDDPEIPLQRKAKPQNLKAKKTVSPTKPIKPVNLATPKTVRAVSTPKVIKPAQAPKQIAGTETITDETKAKTAAVSCSKGASIVTSYGFSAVTSKTCSGGTYTYGATRSGKNFEIQVSAANGELTAVKKL